VDSLVAHLTKLAAAFPRDHVTEATLAVYVDELAGLEDQPTLYRILDGFVRSGRHFPPVSDILAEYRQAHSRERETWTTQALPAGRSPMPDSIREEIHKVLGVFDKRAEEMEQA
jgi:hypothetical protein